ncbi:MAG: LysR family transcriptional regulator [Gammaproteobacteria bacterium]
MIHSIMEYKNLPNLSEWAALRAVVEKGGVQGAAQALNIGQPAITKRLRALEATYGLPLMERVGGRLRLNAVGEKVYLLAVQTLDRQYSLSQEIQNMVKGLTSLHLEVTFSIGEHLLPELLLRFSELHPEFKINSRMSYSRKIQSHLATGMIDLALMESPPDHPDILVQRWSDDELWLVCSNNHPLADTDLLPVESLSQLSYILREQRSSPRVALDTALRNIGIDELNIAMEVGSTDTIVNILSRGKHVSFLPRFAVIDSVRKGSLYHLKVKGFRIMRTLWIARNQKNLDHPVAEAFISMLREEPMEQLP